MNGLRPVAVFVVIGMSLGLAAERSESKTESKAEKKVWDNFKVKWTSISHTKTASVSDVEVPEDHRPEVSERVSISLEVEMLDPNLVLGISRAPIIEEITDGKGGNVEIKSKLPRSLQTRYEAPPTHLRVVVPPKPAKWKTAVRSALRLPPHERPRPQLLREVQPSQMQIDLSIEPGKQSGRKIGRVKAYFYALVTESSEYVDVPFKKSDKWVRLTPDVEVQVTEASSNGSMYRLSTKARPEGGGFTRMPSADTCLPERLVTDRQLIGPNGKVYRRPSGMRRRMFDIGSYPSGGRNNIGQITKIRYVIAVNPRHYQIPFVFDDIPLPKL